MDICLRDRKIRIPQELIIQICCNLYHASDIRSARLVNKSFCAAVTPFMTDIWSSPSELFTKPSESKEPDPSQNAAFRNDSRPRWVPNPITLWTWLQIPSNVPLEEPNFPAGKRFEELIFAPDKPPRSSFLRQSYNEYGRKATCWGRISEHPGMFCIVMRRSFLSCSLDTETKRLQNSTVRPLGFSTERAKWQERFATFLTKSLLVVLRRRKAKRLRFRLKNKRYQPLFLGYHEIRTIYFKSPMSEEQRTRFAATKHMYKFDDVPNITADPNHIGDSPWCWLPGLRTFEGRLAVAAQFLFHWKSKELEREYQENETRPILNEKNHRRIVDLFEEEVRAAGVIGVVSMHCYFSWGPWRN